VGGLRPHLPLVHQRVDATGRVARGRRDAGVEIDVDADRAPFLGAEARKLAKPVPAHCCCHLRLLAGKRRFYSERVSRTIGLLLPTPSDSCFLVFWAMELEPPNFIEEADLGNNYR